MSSQIINTKFLRNIREGQYLKNKSGEVFKITAIYNKNTPAQQVHLEGEHYPHLLTELVKLGYSLKHKG